MRVPIGSLLLPLRMTAAFPVEPDRRCPGASAADFLGPVRTDDGLADVAFFTRPREWLPSPTPR